MSGDQVDLQTGFVVEQDIFEGLLRRSRLPHGFDDQLPHIRGIG